MSSEPPAALQIKLSRCHNLLVEKNNQIEQANKTIVNQKKEIEGLKLEAKELIAKVSEFEEMVKLRDLALLLIQSKIDLIKAEIKLRRAS